MVGSCVSIDDSLCNMVYRYLYCWMAYQGMDFMNEQIESYLKQHYCRDYNNSYGDVVEDDHYFMYREDIDGLIELVVRECAEVARQHNIKTAERSYMIHKAIKEHFGVKS